MFECGLCGKQLSSNSSLDRHLLVHSGERPFRCHICGTHFTTNGNMHRHIRGHYRSGGGGSDSGDSDGGSENGYNPGRKRRVEETDGPEPKLPKLSESDKEDCIRSRSPSPHGLELDFRRMSPVEPIDGRPCVTCGKKFASVQEWILHMREHTSALPMIQPQNLRDVCPPLDFQQNGRDFRITTVPQSSMLSPTCTSHSDLSHDEQFTRDYRDMKLNGQYPCRLCKEVFSNLRKLKSHNLVHMINPPYRCNLCNFCSNDKNALKEHMKGHKGDTPYECRLCGLAFTTKANCERHIKNIHSKQTRDEIKECMSYNAQEDNGEASERSPEAVCHVCNIDCKSRSVLRDHMRSSHPDGIDKPFSCRICRQSFMSQTDAVRHVVQAHSEAVSSGTLTNLVERRDTSDRSYDLSSVESLLTISKIPLSLAPARSQQQPDHVTITPTLGNLPNFSAVLPPAMPTLLSSVEPHLSPLITIKQHPQSFSSPIADDDAPLDLSVNKRPTSNVDDSDHNDESSFSDDEKINVTDDSDSPLSDDKIKATADILKIPKHPFPPLIFPGNLPINLQHFQQQYPFYMPPFNSLTPRVSPLGRSFLEDYQENIRRGIQLSAGGGLLSSSNGNFLSNQSSLALSVIAAQAARQEPLRLTTDKATTESEASRDADKVGQSLSNEDNEVQHFTMRNSVLVKKPKQRRYRTERPWRCDLCDKGFTLRSNMERHMKQQHPDTWSQKPKVTGFGMSQAGEAVDCYDSQDNHNTDIASEDDSIILDVESKAGREDEENNLIIDDDVEDGLEEEEDEDQDEEEEDDRDSKKSQNNRNDSAQDLASVTTLLSKASSQNFTFFPDDVDEDEQQTGDEDDDSSGMTSPDCKKSSAYSSAPQKQKCPYCERKFPWSSSLIRHIRTHTGQKPYLCDVCNYPFTTKSNCDRHLLRKHPDSVHAISGYKPYRCARCPNAAFSTNESLRKHEMFKHGRSPPKEDDVSYDQQVSPLTTNGEAVVTTPNKYSRAYTFQCFVCDTALPSHRSGAIQHLANDHPELYQSLVIPEEPPAHLLCPDNDDNSQFLTPPTTSTHADTVSAYMIPLSLHRVRMDTNYHSYLSLS